MIQRFLYDNLISFIGAWIIFLLTLSLWYWIAGILNHIYIKKRSISNGFKDILEPFRELNYKYWSR